MSSVSPRTSRSRKPGRDARGASDAAVQQRQSHPMKCLFERLAGQLRELGMSVSFWDPAGVALAEPSLQGRYCRQMCGREGRCLESMGRLAQQASLEGPDVHRGKIATSLSGCCMLAVPVHQRRRLVGTVVVCFPTLGTAESEEFARACSRGHLDTEAMATLCRQETRHADHQAESLCKVVEWMVRDEQAKEVAKEELATLSTNLANTYEELSLLYSISSSMKVTHGTTEFFKGLCEELLEVMRLGAAAVVLHPRDHSGSDDQVVIAPDSSGLTAEQLVQVSRQCVEARLLRPDSSERVVIDNQFAEHSGRLGLKVEQISTLIAASLTDSDRYRGALIGINKLDGEFDSVDLKLISSISGQAEVFLKNHHLYEDLQDLLMGVLHALTASIDAKDPYTCGHSRRVAILSGKLAQLHGFDEHRVGRIYLAGLLHDIGKIGISEVVLRKTGKLTDSEYDCVKRHPEIGATILSGIRQLEDIVPIMLYHHERPDGRGYPEGRCGKDLPIEALIVGLADSFDAMTSSRPYRPAMPLEVVLDEIRRCSGTQFDPALAELLLSLDMGDFLKQIRADEEANGAKVFSNADLCKFAVVGEK